MKRDTAIDVTRGIALFFVVLGHLVVAGSKTFNWIFSFHMPIFFLLSGMCFNPQKYKSFTHFVKQKFRKRIVPYFGVIVFAVFICLRVPAWRTELVTINSLYLLRETFYYTQPESIHIGQIWFLVALFFAEIILFWLNKFFEKFKSNKYLKIITYIILALIGSNILNIINFVHITRLPFKIDTAITASVLMGIGYEINKKVDKLKRQPIFSIIILLCIGFWAGYKNVSVNICNCTYGNTILYYISAICGSVGIFSIGQRLEKSEILQFYGKNSLFIFAIHSYLIFIFAFIISIIYNKQMIPMLNIPLHLCIIGTIIIYILLEPITIIYNEIIKKFKTV